MNWRSVSIGIVGLGTIGYAHTDRLLDAGVAVVGGMDADTSANERFAERYDIDIYDDPEELLALVDAVIVATPNRFHEEYAVAALDANCSVLLEKPVAHSLDSAERIAEAARWSAGFCMIGFTNRFANSMEALKSFQRAGRFGDICHIEASYIRRRGVPGIDSWFTDRHIAGGGALIDIGVHALDLALYILDFPPIVEVSAATRSTFGCRGDYVAIEPWATNGDSHEYDVDDSVSAFIRTATGATVALEIAWATNRPPDDTLLVRGTDAGARFDRGSDTLTLYESGTDGVSYLADTTVQTEESDILAAEQRAFLEAVARDVPPEWNTLKQGLSVQRVIDAIYRSAAAGRAVRLTPPETKSNGTRVIYSPETNGTPEFEQTPSTPTAPQRTRNDEPQPSTPTVVEPDETTETEVETP